MHVDWDSGTPSFYSPNETFSFRPRGRVMLDLDTTWGSRFAARNTTATGSRAARIGFEGTFFDKGFYTFDVEFAEPSATEVLSAFIGFHDEAGKLDYDVRLGNMSSTSRPGALVRVSRKSPDKRKAASLLKRRLPRVNRSVCP